MASDPPEWRPPERSLSCIGRSGTDLDASDRSHFTVSIILVCRFGRIFPLISCPIYVLIVHDYENEKESIMKISIVIVTYNRIPALCELLESISQQTLKPYEIIIVNDAGNRSCQSKHCIRSCPLPSSI